MTNPQKTIQKKSPPNRSRIEGAPEGAATQDRFSSEYIAYLKELEAMDPGTYAGQIAKLARDGKLERDVLKKLRETLRNPNKMERKEYKYFMQAVAQGKFPKKGKQALRFLHALDGTPKEKEYAVDLLKRLREESTGPLTERTEKEALKKLTDLRNEDLADLSTKETSSIARSIIETAGISSRIDAASEVAEVKRNNWEAEKLPEALAKELDNLRIQRDQLFRKSNEIDRQRQEAEAAEKPDTSLIEELKRQLIQLDHEIAGVNERMKEPSLKEEQ